jgi:ATP-binding cassette subfamily B protein
MLTALWQANRLGEALEEIGRISGYQPKTSPQILVPPPTAMQDNERLGLWIEQAANCLGLEAESIDVMYGDIEQHLRAAGPAIFQMPDQSLLVLLEGGMVLRPDLKTRRHNRLTIRKMMCAGPEATVENEVDALLRDASIPPRKRERLRSAILRERLTSVHVGRCWFLRKVPGGDFSVQLRQGRLPFWITTLAGIHLAEYGIWVLSWWMIGQAALQDHLNSGWCTAWLLLLGTLVPFRSLTVWLQNRISISAGGLLKETLMYSATRLEADEIRHQGAGQLLGRVLESEAMETLALSGGFLALTSILELVVATVVLACGAGGVLHVGLIVSWAAFAALLAWRYLQANRRWADGRLWMTDDLVEQIVGHRTRLAQEMPEHWHDGEDQALARYVRDSAAMDRNVPLLTAFVPRGWMIVGTLGLSAPFVSGSHSPAAIAVGIGGVLLAFRAFKRLTAGLWNLVGAVTAWGQIAHLMQVAARSESSGTPNITEAFSIPSDLIVEADGVAFRYPDRAEPVLRDCSLKVRVGDRILLEGSSGSGKSTFASLIAGLRRPESGILLARGLDRQKLGAANWRQIVAAAPQFHDNYVLTGSLGFNLLMGRRGMLGQKDMQYAEEICQELGLGSLLQRMPAGLLQLVGETGWQLSHGERSRIYIARTLLQGADMILLDESLSALDPENLRLTAACICKRAKATLAVAHS